MNLTADQWGLVESHLAVAVHVARWCAGRSGRHHRRFESFGDAAIDGLIEAAARYPDDATVPFRRFAWSYATRRVVDAIRRDCAAKRGPGRVRRLRFDLIAFAPEPPPPFEELVSPLGPADRGLLRLRFADGLTTGEIADRLGVERRTVQRHIRASLARLAVEAEGGAP